MNDNTEGELFYADSPDEANEIFYSQYFRCDICNASLISRTITITQQDVRILEICENEHIREDKT